MTSATASGAEPAWWREAVVYQIYPRSFADGNGDGVGDLPGILSKVDHLADLGIDAVWLSPIFRSPMADFGYDVSDYCAVDPIFGTDADLDALTRALHARGIRLLLDWVPNHTSDQHPWFVESRSSRTNPKRDWYVWRDHEPDGRPPTNWTATFKGVPAWTRDAKTDQSYLHLFLAEQPDLNWANPEVEAAMHATLRHWLDRGVDGFRADVVHLIGKGDEVDDLPEDQAKLPILWIDRPEGHARLARVRELLDAYPQQPMMVGEVYLLQPGQTASYLGTPERPELHLSFDFRPLHQPWEAEPLGAVVEASQHDFAEPRWPTFVLSNHDRVRHRTRYGSEARARAAAVLSLTVRGTPFLYAGEELGLEDARVPEDQQVDPAGRDGCRAPIPWEASPGHGWPSEPWLPFPPDADARAASVQRGDPDSMLALYRRLIRLRREHPALRRGAMSPVVREGDVLRFERRHEGETLRVAVHLGNAAPTAIGAGTLLVSSDATRSTWDGTLLPDEAVVLA